MDGSLNRCRNQHTSKTTVFIFSTEKKQEGENMLVNGDSGAPTAGDKRDGPEHEPATTDVHITLYSGRQTPTP